MSIIEYIIAALTPHECLGCTKEGMLICYECQHQLERIVPSCYRCGRVAAGDRTCRSCRSSSPLFSVTRATAYEGLARSLVYGVKFERQKAGTYTIAAILARQLRAYSGTATIVTNVPTASSRVRHRGYDQSALVARHLAVMLHLPYQVLLARDGQARQVGKTRQVRRAQLQHAFRTYNPVSSQVLLIDDVLTTGATIEAAAHALRQSGAHRVHGAVFAVAE